MQTINQAEPPSPPSPPHYTNSVDYRTDLEAQRDHSFQLQSQNLSLKQRVYKQQLQIRQLSTKCRQYDLLKHTNTTLIQNVKELTNLVDNLQDESAIARNLDLENRSQKLKNDELRLALTEEQNKGKELRSTQNQISRRCAVLEAEVVRLEEELAQAKRNLIDTDRTCKELQVREAAVKFVVDQVDDGGPDLTTHDYVNIMNYYVRTARQTATKNQHLVEQVRALQTQCQSLRQISHRIEQLTGQSTKYQKLYNELLTFHEQKCRQFTKNVLQRDSSAHRRLTEELDRVTQFYREAVNRKNSHIKKLIDLLNLKGGDLSPRERSELGEIQKGLEA